MHNSPTRVDLALAASATLMDPTERLDRFIARARELGDMRLLKNWPGSNLTIEWHRDRGLRIETANPDEEDLRSFLLTLRQFVSEREPVYLYTIYNIAYQHLLSDELKKGLADARAEWSAFQRRGPVQIKLGQQEFGPEKITDLWINGYYFHNSDDDHLLRQLARGPGAVLSRYVLLDYVTEATNQVGFTLATLRYARAHGLIV
jgi:hypothetical protein